MTAPRRRPGRPPNVTIGAATDASPAIPPVDLTKALTHPPEDKQEKAAPRRRRASVGGHSLKLTAPARPGFKRRFFNDDGNRIADAEELGYTPVSDTKAKTPGLGSSDTRLVGTKANGEPLRSTLMETPDELYAEGVAEKEAANRLIDEAVTAGRDSTGRLGDTQYGHGSITTDR